MKKIKLLIWTVVLIILDSSVTHYIRIFDTVPVLTYAFVICAAVMEEDFKLAVILGGVCGMLYGSLTGENFEVAFVAFALSAAVVNYVKSKYFFGLLKAILRCAVLTAVGNAVMCFLNSGAVTAVSVVLPVLYNSAAVLIIYPVLENTVYNPKKRSLI